MSFPRWSVTPAPSSRVADVVTAIIVLVAFAAPLVFFACDAPREGPRVGVRCETDGECGGNLCVASTCIAPDADDDRDMLANGLELALGTDLARADSDGDGLDDRAELDGALRLVDRDGDGDPDVLESRLADADHDCVADDADADDARNDAPATLVAATCRTAGVCAGAGLAVTCALGLGQATCHYDAVAGFEADEATCDARDNDCDGATDEGFAWQGHPIGVACDGIGACGAGVVECRGPAAATCSTNPDGSAAQGASELCNGVDDDCDGVADDLVESPVAAGCNVAGVCGHKDAGVVARCEAGAWRCDFAAVPRYEANEERSCDGLDNDCDGATDEDFDLAGARVGAACEGLGACGAGVVECAADGRGVTCSSDRDGSRAEATSETCDGRDDDCDGATDEDLAPSASASACTHAGVCAAVAAATCEAGLWRCDYDAVVGYEPARELSCDGRDNDCDGATDEDLALAGVPLGGACAGVGACGAGVVECAPDLGAGGLRCSSDAGGSASRAAVEACNGRDDDCDGATDEGLVDPIDAGCSRLGVCGEGFAAVVAACEGGRWRCDYDAVVGYHAGAELACDGRDEDCDGATDEGFTLGGAPVGSGCDGVGACAAGRVECAADGRAAVCSANPDGSRSEASVEVCNGVDDDCDGAVDDGVQPDAAACAAAGVCAEDRAAVVATCAGGVWRCDYGAVDGFELGRERSCDGRDNDCDGRIDEDLAWGGAAVGASCDGVGQCGRGVVVCAGLAAATCSTNPNGGASSQAAPETCNGLDDDCDGVADDGLAVLTGRAECARPGVCADVGAVVATCAGGAWACDYGAIAAYEAGVETRCDALDNDCDGAVDEALAADLDAAGCASEGVCGDDGVTAACTNGRWACDYRGVDAYERAEETCDGLDNDCDGETDPDCDVAGPADDPPAPDGDADGIADPADNCPTIPNADQSDDNGNGAGDVCDVCEPFDNCGDALDNDCDGASDAADAQGCFLRRVLGVTTDVSGVPAGYTVELGFDHQIIVAAGLSTSAMEDVRLYHRDPATGIWRQIDVMLQPFQWQGGFEFTRMRFKAQAPIHAHAASGEGPNREYALWFGVPGVGKRDQSGVYAFADVFRRDLGDVVGNGWVETEPTPDALGLGNGFGWLTFARPDAGATGSVAWHGMPALTSGRWVWTTYWRWAHGGADADFGVYMQLGDSALGFDAAPAGGLYPVDGVGAGVAWARGRWGFGDAGRGGVGITDGETATLAHADFGGYDDQFALTVDLDARTYHVDASYWGMSATPEVPFDDPDVARLDAIRFGADGVDTAAFGERAIGWTMIRMATPAGEREPWGALGVKEPLGAGAVLTARGEVARWTFDDDRDDPAGAGATTLKDALPDPLHLTRVVNNGGPVLGGGEQHGLVFTSQVNGHAEASLTGSKLLAGPRALHGARRVTLALVTDTTSSNGTYVLDLQDAGGSHRLALQCTAYNALGVWLNGQRAITFGGISNGHDARKVVHVVIDLDAPVAAERVRLYRDGVPYGAGTVEAMPGEGSALDLGAAGSLTVGKGTPWSFDRGAIAYAALHNVALTPSEIAADTILLRADDDRR